MKFIIANFKSHQTVEEAEDWIKQFGSGYLPTQDKSVILAPSFTNLWRFKRVNKIFLAAQDVSPFPPGAYTGAVNARQLKALGVDYCLVGHSERRRWFHETHQEIANKVRELLEQQITPVLCLDEPYLNQQLAALEGPGLTKIIVAYEPVEAIGSGQPQDPATAEQIALKIKGTTPNIPVLYGGSVTAKNAPRYTSQNSIDGLLVGGVSLKPDEFLKLITQA